MTFIRARTNRQIYATTLAAFICVLPPRYASTDDSTSTEYIEVHELEKILRSRDVDEIVETMNDIKGMYYKFPLLKYLDDLWNNRQNNHPDLPWDLISQDILRLEIADILLQAERNGVIDVDTESMHDYARGLVVSEDAHVASSAISILGILDRPSDVDLVVEAVQDPRRLIFRTAILALAKMCNNRAVEALDRLEADIGPGERLKFLTDTRQAFMDLNERTHRCSY